MSQNALILDYLEKNGSITQQEAVKSFGCYRLGARIWELKQEGHKITRVMESSANRYGIITTYARYFLGVKDGTEPDAAL